MKIPVIGTRGPIHGSLDKAVEWGPAGARTATAPPVLLVQRHLVMEGVIHGDAGTYTSGLPSVIFVSDFLFKNLIIYKAESCDQR